MQYLFGPPTPYLFTVYYKMDLHSLVQSLRCPTVADLDASISGIEIDGGSVQYVTDLSGREVTPEEIGSHQLESF